MGSVRDFHTFMAKDAKLKSQVIRRAHILQLDTSNNHGRYPQRPNRVALVLDGEECLDRLYGGYYPDWSSGGEWRNMYQFLTTFFGRLHQSNVHVAVVFNGAVEPARFNEWKARQLKLKANVRDVIGHLNKRMKPPPKAFWVPPCALRTMIRLALRSLNVTVVNSAEDHHQEIMAFCWENGYHGVLSDDGEFAMFNPPRYFSAHELKLSMTHDLTTTEFVIDGVAKAMDVNPARLSLIGALLGCHLLPPADLAGFHEKIVPKAQGHVVFDRVIRAVVSYVRALESVDDYDLIAGDVFGSARDPRAKRLRDAVKYFRAGTKDGYASGQKAGRKNNNRPRENIRLASDVDQQQARGANKSSQKESDLVERIALDLDELDLDEAVAKARQKMADSNGGDAGGKAAAGSLSVIQALGSGVEVAASKAGKYPNEGAAVPPVKPIRIPKTVHNDVKWMALDRHRSGQMSPYIHQILTRGEIKLPVIMESPDGPRVHEFYEPLRSRIYGLLYNLHHARYDYHQLVSDARAKRGQAKNLRKRARTEACAPEVREEYQKLADNLLFQADQVEIPEKAVYTVREWRPYDDYARPVAVDAEELSWPVSTVHKLWFGSGPEEVQRRLRAFFSCLDVDERAVGCDAGGAGVPQHLLLMVAVLHYIVANQKRTGVVAIEKPELDAFLATALSPELANVAYLAEMPLEVVTVRGVHLASLFMQGVEMAILANEACGAPHPMHMCMPWLFFDGKLFHSKLVRAAQARNLADLCDGRMDVVRHVEHLRSVVVNGFGHQFSPAVVVQPPAEHPAWLPSQQYGMRPNGDVGAAAFANSASGSEARKAAAAKKFQKNKKRKDKKKVAEKKKVETNGSGISNGAEGEADVVVEVET